jgi:hypothetical protein
LSPAALESTSVLETERVNPKYAFAKIHRSHAHSIFQTGGLLALLTALAFAINGYHPYAEDAGIYIAGIKKSANPALYPFSSDFIVPYSHLSLFSSWNAWAVKVLGLKLDYYLFFAQILTTWLLLFACLQLARKCFRKTEAIWASVALTAVCLSVPVAGSALSMMDPYVTGRSFSTPLTVFAIAALLDRSFLRSILFAALVGLFHPLMFIYAAGFLLILWAAKNRSPTAIASLIAAALAIGAAVQYSQRNVVECAAYRTAVFTRDYYFLSHWRWYELFGLIAPISLMALYLFSSRQPSKNSTILCQACILTGLTSIAVSLLYARPSNSSHLIAALQTIRPFVIIYFVMFLLLGGVVAEHFLKRSPSRWLALLLAPAAGLSFAQHQTYPTSAHIELPWAENRNDWHKAFIWIESHTAQNAIIALDSDYIRAPGEDSQGFRATSERDALADFSKDGGAAAAFPQLANRWFSEETATTGLNQISDAQRVHRLEPFHVSWIVLSHDAQTAFICPFTDATVKVCQLPQL